jgi:YegS/Rv2252/BmrU family lipid kinase
MKKEKLVLIGNPASNRGRSRPKIYEFRDQLAQEGFDTELFLTEKKNHAIDLCKAIRNENLIVVSLGGDGTINEVVNGLGEETNCIVAAIPIGSGNDFAKALKMSNDPRKLIDLIKNKSLKYIDLSLITSIDFEDREKSRYFINAVGIGLDARVASVYSQYKFLKGFTGYLIAALKEVFSYEAVDRKLEFEGKSYEGRCLLCTVANGKSSGGGFFLTPNADFSDGLLDLCWVDDPPKTTVLRIFPTVLSGKHGRFPEVRFDRARKVRVEARKSVPIHVDGEIIGLNEKRIDIEITGKKLCFFAPQ